MTTGTEPPADELSGPPFTVERYGSLGDSIIAERDWLRKRLAVYEPRVRNAMKHRGYMNEDGTLTEAGLKWAGLHLGLL